MKKPDFNVECYFCKNIFVVKRKFYLDKTRYDKDHNFFCSKECETKRNKTGQYVNCIVCDNKVYKQEKEIEAGSRFCSSSCAAIYNNKIGDTTKGKTKNLICSRCGSKYTGSIHTPISIGLCDLCNSESNCIDCESIIYGCRAIKYCDLCRKKRFDAQMRNRINNGLLFSKSIKCEYICDGKKIKCDSKLEYVCLTYFSQSYDVLDMKRSTLVLQYFLDDKIHHYYPDFEISLKDGRTFIIECKGVVGKKLSDKWNDYNRKSIEKKKVLEKWCQENGYISFWFDQQRHNKIYKSTKIITPISDSGESA